MEHPVTGIRVELKNPVLSERSVEVLGKAAQTHDLDHIVGGIPLMDFRSQPDRAVVGWDIIQLAERGGSP